MGGFIRASENKISREIDCMLVVGDGTPIPNNHNKYVYKLEQVVAVIEVKKNLYYDHLKTI